MKQPPLFDDDLEATLIGEAAAFRVRDARSTGARAPGYRSPRAERVARIHRGVNRRRALKYADGPVPLGVRLNNLFGFTAGNRGKR